MATIIDILDGVYGELKTVATQDIGLSDPDAHIDYMGRTTDIVTPFLGMEWDRFPYDRGFGANTHTDAVNTDANDNVSSVDRAVTYDLTVDIGVILDGDKPRLRDEYLGYVDAQFAPLLDSPTTLHADIDRIRQVSSAPNPMGAESDVGSRSTYDIRYKRLVNESIPAAETVNWNVDVSGTDAYPEHYG